MSKFGAKLGCDGGATVRDGFDLHILQKNITRRASLKWQRVTELGVAFLDEPNEAVETENSLLKARLRELTEG